MNKTNSKSTNKSKFGKGSSRGKANPKRFNPDKGRNEKDSGVKSEVSGESMPVGKPRPMVTNDPGWYEKVGVLSSNASTLWFSNPAGKPMPAHGTVYYNESTSKWSELTAFIPNGGTTITTLYYLPTWGEAYDSNSPINVMNYRLLWKNLGKQSRNTAYTAGDLGQLLINMDAIYILVYEAVRVYGLLNKFSVENYAYGKRVVDALGWEWEDLRQNMSTFRYYINTAIHRINSVHIPKQFSMCSRHSAIYQAIYADTASSKAQFYAFTAGGYWEFSDEDAETRFRPVHRNESVVSATEYYNHWTVELWNTTITRCLDAILGSDFQAIMDADLQRAFGESEMIVFPYMADDYVTEPIYDPLMLLQIGNMEWIPLKNSDYALYSTNFDVAYSTKPSETSSRVDLLHSTIKVGRKAGAGGDVGVLELDETSNGTAAQIMFHCSPTLFTGNSKLLNLPTNLMKSSGILLECTRLMFNAELAYTSGEWWLTIESVVDGFCYGMLTHAISVDPQTETLLLEETFTVRPVINNDARYPYASWNYPGFGELIQTMYQYSIAPPLYVAFSKQDGYTSDIVLKPIREVQDRVEITYNEFKHLNYVAAVNLWDWNQLNTL